MDEAEINLVPLTAITEQVEKKEGGMNTEPKLAYTSSELKKLADDLDDMQEYLGAQVKRMDEVVDSIETGWRGPTARAYRALHRDAALDAVRIQQTMQLLALGVRLSEDGFTKQELETLEQFRGIQVAVDVEAAANALSTPTAATEPPVPRSRLEDL
ncbi:MULTISPECIES: WXG100 family type VII secretion target [Streptomyces]|uniref:WXG100 family type VII secretion target n=1 Tax=Streptomyces TaxID=1883 RepID=UPI001CEF9EA1|nr:WXG100 family type VII secretion target [Streptomyces griseus]